jgi:hypothetical protein
VNRVSVRGSCRQTIITRRDLPNTINVIQVLEVDRFNTLLGEDFPLLLAADQDGDFEITNKGVLGSQQSSEDGASARIESAVVQTKVFVEEWSGCTCSQSLQRGVSELRLPSVTARESTTPGEDCLKECRISHLGIRGESSGQKSLKEQAIQGLVLKLTN